MATLLQKLKARPTILLYRDLLRMAKLIQPNNKPAQNNIAITVRKNFEENRNETNYNKIEEARLGAIRAIANYHELMATRDAHVERKE